MRSHSIHIPFPQKCIDQFHVSKTDQIAKFWNSLIRPLQKDTFWFACRLDCKVLSFQITQFMNVTVSFTATTWRLAMYGPAQR